jgi:4-amino-4-deoxy-L-arabinose transferase-like glycosyltransferase
VTGFEQTLPDYADRQFPDGTPPRGRHRHAAAPATRTLPPTDPQDGYAQTGRAATRWPVRVYVIGIGLVLTVGAALRFYDVGFKPGWQSDEAVYQSIGHNVATTGYLNEHLQYNLGQWTPFLFHPPFYFLVLAGWFKIFGSGIPQARTLGVCACIITFILLARLIWKQHGPGAALVTIGLVVFDGWLLYVDRISYIENLLFVLIVGGFLLYQRALEKPTYSRFLLAGLLLGCAVVFKQTGTYVLPTVALNWLIVRRDGRKHLTLFAGAVAVIAAYLGGMIWLFDFNGHQWFVQQSLVQVERVLGLRHSLGTLTSPIAAIHLLSHQYGIFIPSVLVALASIILIVRRVIQCLVRRSVEPIRDNSMLFSWSVAGLVVFGSSDLRFPQYFALILIPLYCFLWTETYRYVRAHPRRLIAIAVVVSLVMVAGLGSFYLRVLGRDDNVLRDTKIWADKHLTPDQVVVTQEQIGDLIKAKWCSIARAGSCLTTAVYAITYTTYLAPAAPPGDKQFYTLMKGATKVATFHGFKETVTIWSLANSKQ